MARGRMLNNSISANLGFHKLPDDTCKLLATWTIAHLDYNGIFYGDPAMVKSIIFPRRTDLTIEQVEAYLCAMEKVGLIVIFEANGDLWQWWPGFAHNQIGLRPDKEARSRYPEPPERLQKDSEKAEEIRQEDSKDTEEIQQEDGKDTPEVEEKGNTTEVEEKAFMSASADYQDIRLQWITLFPDKPKPRENNQTLSGKVKTRMKCAYFRKNWKIALERASQSRFLSTGGFFDLSWFLKNDDNWEKCLNGNYDDKKGQPQVGQPGKRSGPDEWLARRLEADQ